MGRTSVRRESVRRESVRRESVRRETWGVRRASVGCEKCVA